MWLRASSRHSLDFDRLGAVTSSLGNLFQWPSTPLIKEHVPNVQYEFPLVNLHSISSCAVTGHQSNRVPSSTAHCGEAVVSDKDNPQSSLFQSEQKLSSESFTTLVTLLCTHSHSLIALCLGTHSCTQVLRWVTPVHSRAEQSPSLGNWWCWAWCTPGHICLFWLPEHLVDSYPTCHLPKPSDVFLWCFSSVSHPPITFN